MTRPGEPPSDAVDLVERARRLVGAHADRAAEVVDEARSRCARWELATDEL